MSILEMCYKYYRDYKTERGVAPTEIRMYKCEFDSLKEEVKEKLMMPYTAPGPDMIYGMKIIIVGTQSCGGLI